MTEARTVSHLNIDRHLASAAARVGDGPMMVSAGHRTAIQQPGLRLANWLLDNRTELFT